MKLFLATLLASFVTFNTYADSALPDYPADKIAAHTWVIHGPTELPTAQNKGFMNNPVIVITDKSTVIMDPGSSKYSGEMVLRQVKSLTSNPVTHVFNSHIHGDHWLGNEAIKSAYPDARIFAHPQMIKMAHDGAAIEWIDFMEQLTEGATSGTTAVIPANALSDKQEIKVDNITFRVYLTDHAHTRTDAMIEIVEDSVLVLGDNVLNQRVGRMDDGSFRGNQKACDIAREVNTGLYVPGHGPSGNADSTLGYCDYLNTIYTEAGKNFDDGLSDFEMKSSIVKALSLYSKWPGFDREVGKHISLSVLEYEQAEFE